MRKMVKKYLLGIILILFMIALPTMSATPFVEDTADASSSTYTISGWQKKEQKEYYNSREGVTYIVSLYENNLFPIQKIRYSAFQVSINQEDISRDDDDNITNPFALDKDENEIDRVEIVLNQDNYGAISPQGLRLITFEVTAYEWSAYQFYVEWDSGEEILEEASDFFYSTNIDSSYPYIELVSGPVMQNNGYMYEYLVRANHWVEDRSANSGFKKIRVYRILNGVEENISEYTTFTNPLYFYGSVLAIRGEYFIEATDGVGNVTYGTVTKIDFDISKIATIASIENTLQRKAEYKQSIIDNLEQKYIIWQILSNNPDTANSDIEEARIAMLDAQNAAYAAEKKFVINLINRDYIDGEVVVENLNHTSFPEILYGETVTMNVSFALFNTSEVNKAVVLETSQLNNAKKVLALNIDLASNLKDIATKSFETPITITIPIDNCKKAVAVNVVDTNSGKTYNNLRIDEGQGWVRIHLTSTKSVVNLVIDEGAEENTRNLNYLYLLFLIIPIGGAIVLVVYRKRVASFFKKLKKSKKV